MYVLRPGYVYEKPMKPTISIVIPVFNAAGFIERCLDSCLSQTFSSLEVIAVDDGSTDDSFRILEEYARKDSRVRPVVNKNELGGAAEARDYGVKQAKGAFIFFLDSDDYIPSNAIERLYNRQLETGSDIIVGDFEFVGHPVLKQFHYPATEDFMDGEDFLCLVFDTETPCIWGKLIRTSLFEGVCCYEQRIDMGEDLYTLIHLCLANEVVISFLPSTVYYYVQRAGSVMNETDEYLQADRCYCLKAGLLEIPLVYFLPVELEQRLMVYIAQKECYYLRVYGTGGKLDAEGFSDSIRFFFHEKGYVRKALWKKNKRIFFLLAIGGYSPDLAKKISDFSRRLFSGKQK